MRKKEIERAKSNNYSMREWSDERVHARAIRYATLAAKSDDGAVRDHSYYSLKRMYTDSAIAVLYRQIRLDPPRLCGRCRHVHKGADLREVHGRAAKVCPACVAEHGYRQCGDCGILLQPQDVVQLGDKAVCQTCADTVSFTCQNCGTRRPLDAKVLVWAGHDEPQAACCSTCASEAKTLVCGHTGNRYFKSRTSEVVILAKAKIEVIDGEPVIAENVMVGRGTAFWKCSDCTSESPDLPVVHASGSECPAGMCGVDGAEFSAERREGRFSFFGYHSAPFYRGKLYRNDGPTVKYGLECEVEGDFVKQSRALAKAGFTQRTLFASRDATVDVEWITRPLAFEELVPFLTAFTKAMAPVAKAVDSRKSCGCHHNVDKSALTEEGWGKCAIAIHTHWDKMTKFNGRHRSTNYFRTTPEMNRHSPREAYTWCRSNGKMAFMNVSKERVVEFRLPAMVLDTESAITQSTLYKNLVTNAKDPSFDPRGPFEAAFGPFDDMMKNVLIRKEIIPCPEGMEMPEDPERPWKKVRRPAVLPAGRRTQHAMVGDTVTIMTEEEVHYRTGSSVSVGIPAESACVVIAECKDTLVVLHDGAPVEVPRAATHLSIAVPAGAKSIYSIKKGDVLVCTKEGELKGAVAAAGADGSSWGNPLESLSLKWLSVPKELLESTALQATFRAWDFRKATEEELSKMRLPEMSWVPEGRAHAWDFRVGDIVRMRPREDCMLEFPGEFYAVDYNVAMAFMAGCRFRVLTEPAANKDMAGRVNPKHRYMKVQILDRVEEYEARKAARKSKPGVDWSFTAGMFLFTREGEEASIPDVPAPQGFLTSGDVIEFKEHDPSNPHMNAEMAYLAGTRWILTAPQAVFSDDQPVIVRRLTTEAQERHMADLPLRGRWDDWKYVAGMFRKADPQG